MNVIPNCRVDLIALALIENADFEMFNTDLGIAMKALKYQEKGVVS